MAFWKKLVNLQTRILRAKSSATSTLKCNFHTSNALCRKPSDAVDEGARSILYYFTAGGVLIAGLSYAAVPMYRIFCQATGLGGEVQVGHDGSKISSLTKRPERQLTVRFSSDTAAGMMWDFKPQQAQLKVIPGETALAFYTATNPTDKPIIGVSTYNVIPYEAGQYFNKIQCFCFEEQRLNPHEQVDMPVFFYIDPEYDDDPKLYSKDEIILSYTFFEAKEGIKLPIPSYATKRH
ncbi:Cytochrome c oxidase assembly protein COX11, mitochondrial [Frankliniella fusca]|uniref:Cytochrome c oxidase assembly protein COX11, mitochondrial n=1 Tax=Frankliniella fusca TaxID=407009 RepID=A0AAE1L729_9NEOP|nr:Cytochrome c oxidase assembly protein COX11, mitochondrial [Frankliniella fusca]